MWWLGADTGELGLGIGIISFIVALIGMWLSERSSRSKDKVLEIIRKNQEEVFDQMNDLTSEYNEAATNKAKETKINKTEFYNIDKAGNIHITYNIVGKGETNDK